MNTPAAAAAATRPSPADSPRAATARERAVLTTAAVRAAERLGLRQSALARALGVSEATVSRMAAGRYRLDPARKEWELAALLVRLFRSLDSIVGGDDQAARAWLDGGNLALNARPIELLATVEGLLRVVQYLDAARGRV